MTIAPEELTQILPDLVRVGQSADELIDGCLQALLAVGFENARFYELDDGDPDDGVLCALTAHAGTREEVQNGYTIPWRETALYTLGSGTQVVVADNSLLPVPKWQRDLGLIDRPSVDVPVMAGGKTLGLLAADCSPSSLRMSAADRAALGALGVLAGSALLAELVSTRITFDQAFRQPPTETTPDEFACEAATLLCDAIGGYFAAVFRFDWRRARLVKICQFNDGVPQQVDEFAETYRVGERLTGSAWEEPRLHYIPDFPRFRRNRPRLVADESIDWHANQQSIPVHTALYTILGRESEPRYLIRILNRRDRPELSFLNRRAGFEMLSGILSVGMDDLIVRRRLDHVAMTARAGIANVTRPVRVLQAGVPGLRDEGLPDFVFVCKTVGSWRPTFVFVDGRYIDIRGRLLETEYPTSFPTAEVIKQPGKVFSRDEMRRAYPTFAQISDEIRGNTSGGRGEEYACFAAVSGQVESIFIARVPAAVRKQAPEVGLPPASLAAAQTLVGLFTEAVDSKYAYFTVIGARHALGYIGHELGTPLAILGDAAAAGVVTVFDELSGRSDRGELRNVKLLRQLRLYYDRIQDSRGATNSALRVAPLVAQLGEGTLSMYIDREEVIELIDSAASQVLVRTRGSQVGTTRQGARDARFKIDIQPSVRRVGSIGCDRYLLRQLLVNLLDNGVKYSMPRFPGQAMSVTVSAQLIGRDQVSVSVQNWGQPIRQKNTNAIFEAFVRGEQEDRLSAIRGMGLGLYVSRLIATAHNGTLDLRSSELRNEGPPGTRDADGYLTTFELRLPANLPSGVRQYAWLEGKGTEKQRRQS